MSKGTLNADGNLVINPLELVLMEQDMANVLSISTEIEDNLKEQIAFLKESWTALWEQVAAAATKGTKDDVITVLHNSMVFYNALRASSNKL